MLREIYIKIGIILSSFIIGLLCLEVGLRFFLILPTPFVISDPRLILDERQFWLNLPNQKQVFSNRVDFNNAVVTTDENGLRNIPCRERAVDKDTRRIYIIGDSQTFGWGLSDDDSWPNRLQCLLNHSGQNYAVYNLGVPGTNLDQYYYRTRMIYDLIRKKDLLVYVMSWNDWHSDQSSFNGKSLSKKCSKSDNKSQSLVFCPDSPLRFYGLDSSWRQSFYKKTGVLVPSFDSGKSFVATIVFSSAIAYLSVPLIKGLYLRYRSSNTIEKIGSGVPESNRNLMVRLSVETKKLENVKFVFLPSRISYADNVYKIYSKSGSVFKKQDFLFEMGRGVCTEKQLHCFSLFDALNTKERGEYDFSFDGHLNSNGALAVANYFMNKIVSERVN